MPLLKKNTTKKRNAKASNELSKETIIVTKKMISINDIILPEKFQHLNDMLTKTTFIN